MHSTNYTGESNVTWTVSKAGITTRVAEVSIDNGEKKIRFNFSRSVNKYGLLPAMKLVIDWRKIKLKN